MGVFRDDLDHLGHHDFAVSLSGSGCRAVKEFMLPEQRYILSNTMAS